MTTEYLKDVVRELPAVAEARTFVGLAGTVTTAAAVEQGLAEYDRDRIHGFVLTHDAAEDVFRTLATESRADRIHNPGLEEARADVIVGGLCVLVAIYRYLGFDECLVSRGRHPRRPHPLAAAVIHSGSGWRTTGMAATENAARIRRGYDAFNQGDVAGLIDLFDESIVWHFPGSSKLAGDHVGRDATLAVLGAYGEASGGSLVAQPIDVMASDEHVTGWARDTAEANGRTLDISSVVIFAMRDGKVIEAWHHVGDQAALDAFLA